MKRRYKASGLCIACKTTSTTTTPRRKERESLSVTPCEVRIEFRDTEVGLVDEGDKVRAQAEGREGKNRAKDETVHEDRDKEERKMRARKGVRQSQMGSMYEGEESDGDIYVEDAMPSASLSSTSSENDADLLPRKHKAGARPRALPRPKTQTRKRRRSPGVLERIHGVAAVKQGKRGRPPRQKMVWPDRIDAGEFELVEKERMANTQKRRSIERSVIKPKKVPKRLPLLEETVSLESRKPLEQQPSQVRRLSCIDKAEEPISTSRPPCSRTVDEVNDLARIIALEAAKRDKKWR
ncbi:uncharacterized protein N0V89_011061 [Didymosphaeria variabile]|uniref:Uncharacterized protein n=1 Tax=Didymosphaeria variabile TaxID=1932322 RepID=A0A9W9C754_9PLEO|nr:uncharacterized protein N0V89_011061 [Didymosphaeria variabile]KAJ4347123.1 hypothetical protein N0V89_011061 [Didymosphaeria variabile]